MENFGLDQPYTAAQLSASRADEHAATNLLSSLTSCGKAHIAPSELTKAPPQSDPRKPVLFMHFHKAGGTTMCQLATLNDELMPEGSESTNCNSIGDSNWFQTPGNVRSCDERRVMGVNRSYMSLERWIDNSICTDDLLYATTLRDPLDRIISNLNYEAHKPDKVMEWVKPGASQFNVSNVRGAVIDSSTASYDNFFVRTLAGPDAFMLPAGAMTRQHLDIAKKRLARFTVIVPLDRFDDHSVQLSNGLGWNVTTVPSDGYNHNAHEVNKFTDEQMAVLKKQNALDSELFCYGKALAEERSAVAKKLHPPSRSRLSDWKATYGMAPMASGYRAASATESRAA